MTLVFTSYGVNLAVHNDEARQSDGQQTTSYQVRHYISTKQSVKC